ncbi:signal peptidase II [Sphaerotilus mobilis]|uniref:Lipoprotein signal peptidase n=1 Tax=Sphaerotilus mobilis TaxID=47994 RepID=A0A4Q7LEC4_9BURK|nr:signal peptidase II [Sphaerotilus mobilis]RZS52352.1 signal peptidase II [Sphaerotilus mobilis]
MPPAKKSTTTTRRHAASGPGLWTWLALALLIIVLDQFTKVLIVGRFAHGDSVVVTSWFNLVRVHNPGAAFSFLSDASGWQRWFFTGIGVLASGLFIWLLRAHANQRLFALALTLLLGGAIGNVIDRMWHGHVIDFLQVHWDFLAGIFPGGYFPAFNVADSAISGGAIALVLDELRRVRRS